MTPFDIERIICINVKQHNESQLFAISRKYDIDFPALVDIKRESGNLPNSNTGKIWIDLNMQIIIAYESISIHQTYIEKGGVRKAHYPKVFNMVFEDYDAVGYYDLLKSITPIKTPKFTKTDENLIFYTYYIGKGYDLKIESFDRALSGELKPVKEKKLSIDELTHMMNSAVENEEYELAAKYRDQIKEIKKDTK